MNNFSPQPNKVHHIIIASILILECTTLLYSSCINLYLALDQAMLQYTQFALAKTVDQFPKNFQHYSDTDFLKFILGNHLPSK